MLGKFSAIISLNIFSVPFFLSFPYGTPIIQTLVHLTLSQSSLRLFSVLFNLFSLFCSASVISTSLSSASLIRSSASCILLLVASNEFFFFFGLFATSWATPAAYGGSQARGRIGAVAAGLCHSHSNTRSETSL